MVQEPVTVVSFVCRAGASGPVTRRLSSASRAGTVMLLVALAISLGAAPALAQSPEEGHELPAGLTSFLEARLLESAGSYRAAADLYAQALGEDPENSEIRARYASLLLELGLADSAYSLLEGRDLGDWYTRRVYALALAQLAGRRSELIDQAEAALRDAFEERNDEPNLQLSLAQILERKGKVEEAQELISNLLASRSGNAQLLAYDGSLLRRLGRTEEAADRFAQCARISEASTCREELVELLVELDRPAEAADVMLAGLKDDDLDRMMRAAALLSEGGRSEQALQVVRKVLAAVPDSEQAKTLEAYLLSSSGRFTEAAATFRQLLRKDRENVDLLLGLAWAEVRGGDIEGARTTVDRTWELVQKDVSTAAAVRCCLMAARVELAGGRPLIARDWVERIGDREIAGADYLRLLAETYRSSQQYNEGVAAMLRAQPQVSERYRNEAVAFEAEFRLRGGDLRGLRTLRKLLDSDDLAEVTTALQVLQATDRWGDVTEEAAKTLQRFPGERSLEFARAAAFERLGQTEEAVRLFRALVEDPQDAASANYLGYLWADAGTNLEEAEELIRRAVNLDPENPSYLDSLGWVCFRLGRVAEAEDLLRRAIAFGGDDGTVLAHLGEVLAEQGKAGEARELLLRSLDLGCEHPDNVRSVLNKLE
jgi:tetratricopeptide (TPR) repeat protein